MTKTRSQEKNTQHNNRYQTALEVLDEYHQMQRPFGNACFKSWCKERLNTAEKRSASDS